MFEGISCSPMAPICPDSCWLYLRISRLASYCACWIAVAARLTRHWLRTYASSQVEAIPVERRVSTLYLLHATQWGNVQFSIADLLRATQGGNVQFDVADGTNIGHYQIHYVDGSQATIPIIYGEDVRDWWSRDHKKLATRGQVVWVGQNAATKQIKIYLRLYLNVWENPHPEKTIASLDYVSAMTVAAPFCVAITAEMP